MKLSYSALKNYLTCPYKYYLSQFFKSLPSPKFEGGRKVHEVISKFYEDLIKRGTIEERAIYPTITRYAQEVLGEEFLNYILVFKNFERFELWRRRVMMLTPIAVEEVFESNEFIGVPDVVFVCNDGKKCVVDWKTFSIPRSANMQAYFYQKLTGADYIIFFSLIRGVKKIFRGEEVEECRDIVERVRKEILVGNFHRNRGVWCKDCEYRLFCELDGKVRLGGVL